MTGTLGKGIAAITMDDEFIAENNSITGGGGAGVMSYVDGGAAGNGGGSGSGNGGGNGNGQLEHVGDGLISGSKSLGHGIVSGLTGVIYDPIKGAKEDGFAGALKGVGKGLVGLVAKPTVGLASFATQTLQGMSNTASFILQEKKQYNHRARLPRHIDPSSRQLCVYSEQQAREQYQRARTLRESKNGFNEIGKALGTGFSVLVSPLEAIAMNIYTTTSDAASQVHRLITVSEGGDVEEEERERAMRSSGQYRRHQWNQHYKHVTFVGDELSMFQIIPDVD